MYVIFVKKKEKKRILGRVRHIKLGFNLNLEGDIFKVYDRHSLGYDEKILNIGTLSKNVLIFLSVAFTHLFLSLKQIIFEVKNYFVYRKEIQFIFSWEERKRETCINCDPSSKWAHLNYCLDRIMMNGVSNEERRIECDTWAVERERGEINLRGKKGN